MVNDYNRSPQEVLEELHTSPLGLTAAEAAARLAAHGPNKLKEAEKPSLLRRFLAQLKDPMLLMLMAAAAISAVTNALSGESFTEVFIILAVVLLNAVLGVVQESKAEAAIEALQTMTAAKCKVLRDGHQTVVENSQLVPGDVVVLEAGDAIPADGRHAGVRLAEDRGGRSHRRERARRQGRRSCSTGQDVPLGDRKNMCYMGSTVVYGRGRAVITATGMDTEMGKIAGVLAQTEQDETPLQRKLTQLGTTLSKLVVAICVFIFIFDLVVVGDYSLTSILSTFMVAVSLAVAAIPEGLATVVTVVLSIGVTNMSKRHAVIRRLTAVETLGCTQVICSDKTGTLTQNKMTVVEHTGPLPLLAAAMTLCNDAILEDGGAQGEPTEAALVNFAAASGCPKPQLEAQQPRCAEAPFDSSRKMMSTIHRTDGGFVQYTKGAPDEVLRRCTHYTEGGAVLPMTEEKRAAILADNKAMADKALRVLAAAERRYDSLPEDLTPQALEQQLCFIGLAGMIDPVRPEVKDAVAQCRAAGIRPVMITGDHKDTAVAIARELGIITDASQAVTGSALDGLSDDELDQVIDRYGVYARVQPEHKVRIVNAWRQAGRRHRHDRRRRQRRAQHQVRRHRRGHGYHRHRRHQERGGHGAVRRQLRHHRLRRGRGAAHLRQHPQGHPVPAGQQHERGAGRVLCHAAGLHAAEPRTPAVHQPHHRLLPRSGAGTGAGGAGHHDPPAPRQPRRRVCRRPGRGSRLSGRAHHPDHAGRPTSSGTAWRSGYFEMPKGVSDDGMTMAFLTMSMCEIFHSFNMRSQRKSVFSLPSHNKVLWAAMAGSLVLTTAVLEVPVLANAFGFTPVSWPEYGIALALAFLVIPVVELVKLCQRRAAARRAQK